MRSLDDILDDFTDTELAYLNKYQIETYLAGTQAKIRNYIFNKRGLTQPYLNDLMTENEKRKAPPAHGCPRCKSEKLRTDSVEWVVPVFRAGAEDEYAMLYEIQTGTSLKKDKITCNVCGYVLYDPNCERRPFFKRLADIFFDSPLWSVFRKE